MPVYGIFGLSGAQEGLEDCKVARNNGDGSFGTNVDVASVQLMGVRYNVRASRLEGDNRTTARRSRVVSAQVTLRMGAYQSDFIDVITGGEDVQSSGASPDVYQFKKITNATLPAFGINGRADGGDSEGSLHVFLPNCSIMEDFELRMELNQFIIPELTVEAIGDSYFLDENGREVIGMQVEYEDRDTPVQLPPFNWS